MDLAEEMLAKAEALRENCYNCKNCSLGQCEKLDGYNPHVYGYGNVASKIFFVAEAPGFTETQKQIPLIGKSGQLYEKKILAPLGLERDDIWTTNTVLCRPPNNRKPTEEERKLCLPHFEAQLKLMQPKLIIVLGSTPLEMATGISSGITKCAGELIDSFFDIPTFVLLHPSFILRTGKYDLLDDLVEKLRQDIEYIFQN